jgi:DnaJ-class molecular chaperone
MNEEDRVRCDKCNGTGRFARHKCEDCGGLGYRMKIHDEPPKAAF